MVGCRPLGLTNPLHTQLGDGKTMNSRCSLEKDGGALSVVVSDPVRDAARALVLGAVRAALASLRSAAESPSPPSAGWQPCDDRWRFVDGATADGATASSQAT